MATNKKETFQEQTTAKTTPELVVTVANGSGNEPVVVPWQDGDTVATVLERAGVVVGIGRTATLGRRRVRNPARTSVRPGEVIVVAGKPSNG